VMPLPLSRTQSRPYRLLSFKINSHTTPTQSRRDLLDTGIPGPKYKGDGGGAGLERRKKRRKKTKASEAPTPDGSSDRGEVQPLAGGSEVGLASRKTQRKTTEPGMTHATDGSSNMEEAQSLAGDGTEAGSRSVSLG